MSRCRDLSLRALGESLCEIFSLPGAAHLTRPYAKDIPAEKAVVMLQEKLRAYFFPEELKVMISDGIVSDAAAGKVIHHVSSLWAPECRILDTVHLAWVIHLR